MSDLIQTVEKETIRREIMELCAEAAPYGAGLPVLKAALRRFGHELEDQELMRQVDYLAGKQLVKKDVVENRRLGINRCIVSLRPEGIDYLEGNGPEIMGVD